MTGTTRVKCQGCYRIRKDQLGLLWNFLGHEISDTEEAKSLPCTHLESPVQTGFFRAPLTSKYGSFSAQRSRRSKRLVRFPPVTAFLDPSFDRRLWYLYLLVYLQIGALVLCASRLLRCALLEAELCEIGHGHCGHVNNHKNQSDEMLRKLTISSPRPNA